MNLPLESQHQNPLGHKVKVNIVNSVMFTYTYERQDIIQIALKRLPGGGERRKKRFVRISPPFTCYMNC
jgi:hypothetical protein